MNKSSFKTAVAVAVTAAAVFCVGCSEKAGGGGNGTGLDPNDPNNPNYVDPNDPFSGGGGGNIVGEWSLVEERSVRDGKVEVETIPDDYKEFYSFSSSRDLAFTSFKKYGNIWIESVSDAGKYTIKGDSVCAYDDDCIQYRVSGNTLYLGFGSYTMKFVKGNIASTKSSFGSSLKSQDPALNDTEWERPSSNPDCEWCGNERIEFWSSYYESPEIYLSKGDDHWNDAWYTESGKLTLVVLKCDSIYIWYEEGGRGEIHTCVSTSVDNTITLDYQLANGTLRLKAPGKDWDTWTRYVDDYKNSLSKANVPKVKRGISPFKAFRR